MVALSAGLILLGILSWPPGGPDVVSAFRLPDSQPGPGACRRRAALVGQFAIGAHTLGIRQTVASWGIFLIQSADTPEPNVCATRGQDVADKSSAQRSFPYSRRGRPSADGRGWLELGSLRLPREARKYSLYTASTHAIPSGRANPSHHPALRAPLLARRRGTALQTPLIGQGGVVRQQTDGGGWSWAASACLGKLENTLYTASTHAIPSSRAYLRTTLASTSSRPLLPPRRI